MQWLWWDNKDRGDCNGNDNGNTFSKHKKYNNSDGNDGRVTTDVGGLSSVLHWLWDLVMFSTQLDNKREIGQLRADSSQSPL